MRAILRGKMPLGAFAFLLHEIAWARVWLHGWRFFGGFAFSTRAFRFDFREGASCDVARKVNGFKRFFDLVFFIICH